jgi:hypothetical protein
MATTTTNFGWDIPQSTDLVKDGATAIAALGQDIDTAFVDLKGGTTGQVLSKASGTDLDFSWTTVGGGGGKVLQVVYGMYNTQTLINNTGYTDTGLSASITPSASTSKILVLTSNFAYWAESSGNPGIGTQIVRGSTAVYEQHPSQNSLAIIVGASGTRGLLASVNMQYLDSPATTSSTTYKVQSKSNCGAYFQWDGGKSNIILMEIGA